MTPSLIEEAVREVKKAFPKEGIKVFQYEVNAFPRGTIDVLSLSIIM